MSENTDLLTSKVFNEINKTIKILGVDKLLDILKYHRNNKTAITEETLQSGHEIIAVVCHEFQIEIQELYNSQVRTTDKRSAIGICACLLEKNLGYYGQDVSFVLKRQYTNILFFKNEINALNPKSAQDNKILKKIDNINQTLKKLHHERTN